MKIIVTGGAGFIGSHLTEVLLKHGHDIVVIDNLFTGQKENISHLLDYKNFEFIRHDIAEPIRLEADQVYHLASPASPVHYQYNPIQTTKTNVMGTINMLGLAYRVNGRILLASTSEVYGDPKEHPQKESYWGNVNPIGPRSCYDEGKRVAETLMMDYYRQNNVDVKIVRIFNTYGPNMSLYDGRVVSNFIVQALQGEDITIFGDGLQTRSFCYVDDLVDGLMKMMNLEPQNIAAFKRNFHPGDTFIGPVNLGNPNEFTIKELAEIVVDLTGSKSNIVYKNLPEDDPKIRQPDISLAKEKLSWKPEIKLIDGLKPTIKYFEEALRKL
jgi:UDP-glucuronate decarboxylase